VAGKDSGFCTTIKHRAIHRLLCHHPSTALSGYRSEWLLAVPYSENGPQGDTLRNRGRHKLERYSRTPENSKRSLPKLSGSMEQAFVCVRVYKMVLL
jgi:hypothetical protein